ncbi:hypothetical protein VTO73DRAFT_2770 [Trametes versicolor]
MRILFHSPGFCISRRATLIATEQERPEGRGELYVSADRLGEAALASSPSFPRDMALEAHVLPFTCYRHNRMSGTIQEGTHGVHSHWQP